MTGAEILRESKSEFRSDVAFAVACARVERAIANERTRILRAIREDIGVPAALKIQSATPHDFDPGNED